jgi:RNA polymerase sigma factor (sigma-70 family)
MGDVRPAPVQPASESKVQEAFLELLNGHQGVIHRICRAYATEYAERQDLFQEIVYQLWRSYPRFRRESSQVTWLYRVALNTALTTVRRRARLPRLVPLDTAPEPSAPQIRAHESEGETLHRLVGQLGRIDRAILMCYLEDLSYARIAEIVGISESNVGARLTRIRTRLRTLAGDSDESHGS